MHDAHRGLGFKRPHTNGGVLFDLFHFMIGHAQGYFPGLGEMN
jgi:hypothetical protein